MVSLKTAYGAVAIAHGALMYSIIMGGPIVWLLAFIASCLSLLTFVYVVAPILTPLVGAVVQLLPLFIGAMIVKLALDGMLNGPRKAALHELETTLRLKSPLSAANLERLRDAIKRGQRLRIPVEEAVQKMEKELRSVMPGYWFQTNLRSIETVIHHAQTVGIDVSDAKSVLACEIQNRRKKELRKVAVLSIPELHLELASNRVPIVDLSSRDEFNMALVNARLAAEADWPLNPLAGP